MAEIESVEAPIFLPLSVEGNDKANHIVGNAEANLLNGGAGADKLEGGQGDDMYFVDNAGDMIVEQQNGGNDTVNASVSYTLSANVENLFLTGATGMGWSTDNINGTGNALNNHISGNAGNNYLSGGDGDDVINGGMSGADTLDGGNGNDVYFINNRENIVVEGKDGGNDTVWVNIEGYDVSKLKNVEVVKFSKDVAADNFYNRPAYSEDSFLFNSKLGAKVKKIDDFSVKTDTICLSKTIFSKIAKKGDLNKSAFWTGSKAHDASDRIIYDKKAGVLSYDADGSGAGKAIKFATINKNLKMTADDFFVM